MLNFILDNKSHKPNVLFYVLFLLFLNVGIKKANAQLVGFQSSFFQNQYLTNPAMAGLDKGLNLNLSYQKQANSVTDGQKLQSFTADYQANEKVSLGLLVSNEQAGLISRTKLVGTYAYHLPLSANNRLNFGVSFGINNRYLDYSKVVGDQSDLQAQNFNQNRLYADGDVGISFTGKALTIQAAVPNVRDVFFKSDEDGGLAVDRSTLFASASYKIATTNFTIEPKIALRGVKGFDDIYDGGFNFTLPQYKFNILALYHTSKSETFGFGVDLKAVDLLFTYTNSTGQVQGYNNNMFEAGLKFKLFTK